MGTVQTVRMFQARLAEVESCWYDTAGWPRWVEGLDEVLSVQGDWPRAGAMVTWRSRPAGRGTVNEKVVEYEPRAGQSVQVADPSIVGTQTVVFTPVDDAVEVALSLDYKILKRSPVTSLVDFLFVKRAMRTSLEMTLSQFGARLEHVRSRPPSGRAAPGTP